MRESKAIWGFVYFYTGRQSRHLKKKTIVYYFISVSGDFCCVCFLNDDLFRNIFVYRDKREGLL